MVELVELDRSPEGLARELEPSAPTVRDWVVQVARVGGQRHHGPTTAEAEKLRGLRRENRRLRGEREVLVTTTCFARKTDSRSNGSSGSSK